MEEGRAKAGGEEVDLSAVDRAAAGERKEGRRIGEKTGP